MVSDTCSEAFKKNMDDVMKMSAAGLMDAHPRVRYQAMTALGLLLNELQPTAQKKYHADLMNALLSLMVQEEYIKMKTQATSCMVNFVRGLINADETEEYDEEAKKENCQILYPYATKLVETISHLF